MKKLFAILLAVMLLSLAACSENNPEQPTQTAAPKAELETFEMSVVPDGVEEPAEVKVGYPENFTLEEKEWCTTLKDVQKDVQIDVYLLNDYNCYDINQEYAKEENFFYEEGTFSGFKGYVCRTDEASSTVTVFVYLGCVAQMDDVYMNFDISSASLDLDADPMAMYQLEEVRMVLDAITYTAPAEPAE